MNWENIRIGGKHGMSFGLLSITAISLGAAEQVSSAEEVSSSIKKIPSNIQQYTSIAKQAEKISLKASNDIAQVDDAVNQTVASMNNIAEEMTTSSEEVSSQAEKIHDTMSRFKINNNKNNSKAFRASTKKTSTAQPLTRTNKVHISKKLAQRELIVKWMTSLKTYRYS